MIDLDEMSRSVGSKVLSYEHGRFQVARIPVVKTEPDAGAIAPDSGEWFSRSEPSATLA